MTTVIIVSEKGKQSFLELKNAMNKYISDEKVLVMAETTMKIIYYKIKSENLIISDSVKDQYPDADGYYADTPIIIDNKIPFGEVRVYAR